MKCKTISLIVIGIILLSCFAGLSTGKNHQATTTSQSPIADAGLNQTGKGLITFNGSGSSDPDGAIINFTWNFTYNGNPIELYNVTPTFDFNLTGVYMVMLNVTDNDGNFSHDNVTITISFQSPMVFAGFDQSGHRGVHIMDGSYSFDPDGTIANYTWSFNDNGTQILYGLYPNYDFQNVGNFEITLNITDDDWRYGEATMWVNITNQLPVAHASSNYYYMIDGSTSYDPDGIITNYTWTFTYTGLPQTLYGETPAFRFDINGVYVVMLRVQDIDGALSYDNITIIIDFQDPIANAGVDQSGYKGVYLFNGSGSSDPDGTIMNYTWTFNDNGNQTLYGLFPNYNFQNVGIFVITLNITDNNWRYGEDIMWVNIIQKYNPIAVAGADQITGKVAIFNGSGSYDSDGNITNYTWAFTIDSSSYVLYGLHPSFEFNESGVYVVMLEVTDNDGLFGYDNVTVTVNTTIDEIAREINLSKARNYLILLLIPIGIILLLVYIMRRKEDEVLMG